MTAKQLDSMSRVNNLVIVMTFIFSSPISTVVAKESAHLSIDCNNKIELGVWINIHLKFESDQEKKIEIPAWVLDPRDFLSGAFKVEMNGIAMGRLDNQQYKEWRLARSQSIVFPGNGEILIKFQLSNTHELFQYKMDNEIIGQNLIIYHERWPQQKVIIQVKDDGSLVEVNHIKKKENE